MKKTTYCVRHDTYIPQAYESIFRKFKAKHGKNTSRQLCHLMEQSLE